MRVYRTFGGLAGEFGDTGVRLDLFSPREVLAAHDSDQAEHRLPAPTLLDMARRSWGNDRPEAAAEHLHEAVLHAASTTLCIGWLRDDYGEEHAYLVRMPNGCYQLHSWHQDHRFEAPTDAVHQTHLFALIDSILTYLISPHHAGQDGRDIPSLIAALREPAP